ncbi:hypothetical protein AV530_009794 [Patagioenas fasciata monilis]|uniref:Uncharacterized protein n=1 Tax=Patagioenas fasciata monilis TaxID=372326 RepID=A0A1V4KA18_PATFA|nr:hypothetical protein AV530_009794 [Patagioenas fasciata monilis]
MEPASRIDRSQVRACDRKCSKRGPRRDCLSISEAVLGEITPQTHRAAQPSSACLCNWDQWPKLALQGSEKGAVVSPP